MVCCYKSDFGRRPRETGLVRGHEEAGRVGALCVPRGERGWITVEGPRAAGTLGA